MQSKIMTLYHYSIHKLYQQPLIKQIKNDKKLFLITCVIVIYSMTLNRH